ncbi:hypothetical protein WOLCODRAFT_164286 [Wolfiporia cocos MD-104 SS10]|uniref:Uncharacterized protein n=1 Tax=Wolfiporia cocos (strain MD-104) TaxID=742152 RepID=A0A2H3K296_WOLCO|nr:hypothetical protein WOLCODRAFT_164286 [Wolfiporia cocos MD-104 SS10]
MRISSLDRSRSGDSQIAPAARRVCAKPEQSQNKYNDDANAHIQFAARAPLLDRNPSYADANSHNVNLAPLLARTLTDKLAQAYPARRHARHARRVRSPAARARSAASVGLRGAAVPPYAAYGARRRPPPTRHGTVLALTRKTESTRRSTRPASCARTDAGGADLDGIRPGATLARVQLHRAAISVPWLSLRRLGSGARALPRQGLHAHGSGARAATRAGGLLGEAAGAVADRGGVVGRDPCATLATTGRACMLASTPGREDARHEGQILSCAWEAPARTPELPRAKGTDRADAAPAPRTRMGQGSVPDGRDARADVTQRCCVACADDRSRLPLPVSSPPVDRRAAAFGYMAQPPSRRWRVYPVNHPVRVGGRPAEAA